MTHEFRDPLFKGCEFLVVALPLQALYGLLERARALLRESHCRHLGGFGGGFGGSFLVPGVGEKIREARKSGGPCFGCCRGLPCRL